MNLSPYLPAASYILHLFISITVAIHNSAHLTGDISISCGSAEVFSATDGREWIGDKHTKISSIIQIKGSSTSSTVAADQAQYKSARISRSKFSYAFQLNPGPICIRFLFNPDSYPGFKGFKDLFTVEAGPFILLSNFSASITAAALGVKSFAKEFCVIFQENQPFNINVYPDQSIHSKEGTYAFVNGIEIISLPAHLSFFHSGVQVVGSRSLVHLDYYNIAIEIVHRQIIKPSDDFVNMFGTKATIPKQETNKISNFTWKIPVDVGFKYVIRFHFSELGVKMTETNHVIFKIIINEIIADTNIDLVKERNGHDLVQYKDYMAIIQGHKQEGRSHLLVSLQSSNEFEDRKVPIKGFEILKLNNIDNNLAGLNPLPPARNSPSQAVQILLRVCSRRNIITAATMAAIALVATIVHMMGQIHEANSTDEERKPSARAQRLCRRFTLSEMKSATKDFNHEFVVGKGGFGKVYKGFIDGGKEIVAIKRLKYSSLQGAHEFWTEIEILSELRHNNLVSLIGYCNEHMEMMLVYEYITRGTLADYIYKLDVNNIHSSSLVWKQRLNICIGAGRGLDYLHTGRGIIHRDVKSSNILLDENFVAKVSDFGLAKLEGKCTLQSDVSTNVKGTPGYLDPYYFKTHSLTRKSDVYAFGVLLLEVLCGRRAIDRKVDENKRNLTTWARESINKGEGGKIISADLRGEISEDSLKTFVRCAESCLDDEPAKRPTMTQVVLQLESALEQQDNPTSSVPKEIGVVNVLPSAHETVSTKNTGKLIASPQEQINRKTVNVGENEHKKQLDDQAAVTGTKKNRLQDSLVENSGERYEAIKVDWATIDKATNGFSKQLKGPPKRIYFEGILAGRRVAVVKQTSDSSYRQDISLLSKHQHPNLTKLLGYHVSGKEIMFVCEFKEHTRVEDTLSDGSNPLSWSNRFKIIMGMAQGLEYLIQHSELRILYCHLKPCNILLDKKMNPKIALSYVNEVGDRWPDDSLDVNNTLYAAPKGDSSIKADMYIFGAIVLELLTWRRHGRGQNLISHAWKMWNEEKALDLVYQLGRNQRKFSEKEALRCIQIGLLCTQHTQEYRPEMSLVLKALQGGQDLRAEVQQAAFRSKNHLEEQSQKGKSGYAGTPPVPRFGAWDYDEEEDPNMTVVYRKKAKIGYAETPQVPRFGAWDDEDPNITVVYRKQK